MYVSALSGPSMTRPGRKPQPTAEASPTGSRSLSNAPCHHRDRKRGAQAATTPTTGKPPQMADEWISPETEAKERDYRGILEILVPASKGIIKRHGGGPYLYVDLYAGPGWLEFEGRRFPGSPLIAQEV